MSSSRQRPRTSTLTYRLTETNATTIAYFPEDVAMLSVNEHSQVLIQSIRTSKFTERMIQDMANKYQRNDICTGHIQYAASVTSNNTPVLVKAETKYLGLHLE